MRTFLGIRPLVIFPDLNFLCFRLYTCVFLRQELDFVSWLLVSRFLFSVSAQTP